MMIVRGGDDDSERMGCMVIREWFYVGIARW